MNIEKLSSQIGRFTHYSPAGYEILMPFKCKFYCRLLGNFLKRNFQKFYSKLNRGEIMYATGFISFIF